MSQITTLVDEVAKGFVVLRTLKQHQAARTRSARLAERVHVGQMKRLEDRLSNSLTSIFDKQIKELRKELNKLPKDEAFVDASSIISRIDFNEEEWDQQIRERVVLDLGRAMLEAANAQLMVGKDRIKSTASEFLESSSLSLGDVDGIGIATEFPQSMLNDIDFVLKETMGQDYWKSISSQTLFDFEGFLNEGLKDGLSIVEMSKRMQGAFSEYAKTRATRIARTEAGNALNGARNASIDQLIKDAELEGLAYKAWLSVKMNTTRDSHAAMDGVAANENGVWILNGVEARWPGDSRLPARDRINCLCTIVMEVGPSPEQELPAAIEEEAPPPSELIEASSPPRFKTQKEWLDSLTDQEEGVFRDWSRTDYRSIRDCQFNPDDCDEHTLEQIRVLESALARAPIRSRFKNVYRGSRFSNESSFVNFLDEFSKGEEYTFPALSSTSSKKRVAEDFAGGSYSALIKMKTKTGVDIHKLSSYGMKEAEYILSKGAKFTIDNVQLIHGGRVAIIEMYEVL